MRSHTALTLALICLLPITVCLYCSESEDGEVTYVTTAKQFEKLLTCLDEKWEGLLLYALNQRKTEILEHMAITMHLTEERRGQRPSFLSKQDGRLILFMHTLSHTLSIMLNFCTLHEQR